MFIAPVLLTGTLYTELRRKIQEIAAYTRFLKPEFLEEISESCEIDDV